MCTVLSISRLASVVDILETHEALILIDSGKMTTGRLGFGLTVSIAARGSRSWYCRVSARHGGRNVADE
jgi:hypothetical protein